jgi:hypothetical protein
MSKIYKLHNNNIYFTDFKKCNIVYLKNKDDFRFIDLDSLYFIEKSEQPVFAPMTATAAQRAEAFLRTIGKWEVSND